MHMEQLTQIVDSEPKNSNEPIMYSSKELTILLGVAMQTLLNWRINGKGPKFVTITDTQVGYLKTDVYAWIMANRVDPRDRARAKLLRELARMENENTEEHKN